jgi:hypothetical protein
MFSHSPFRTFRVAFIAISTVLVMSQAECFAETILNIDGKGDNHPLNPRLVTLSAGQYRVDVVGTAQGAIYDAYSPWSSTDCSNINGCSVTDPTTNTGWYTSYLVTSPNISSVTVDGQQIAAGPNLSFDDYFHDYFYRSSTAAWYAAFDGLVFPDPILALSHGRSSKFVLDVTSQVGFALRDGPGLFGDNRGGLSLRITAVPEPSTLLLSVVAVVGMALLCHRL